MESDQGRKWRVSNHLLTYSIGYFKGEAGEVTPANSVHSYQECITLERPVLDYFESFVLDFPEE